MAGIDWHGDQLRPTGVPYVEHLLEALEVLVRGAGVRDLEVLRAVSLHDAVEDTSASVVEVEERFSPVVPEVGSSDRTAKRAAKDAYLCRLPDASSEAVLVKLASAGQPELHEASRGQVHRNLHTEPGPPHQYRQPKAIWLKMASSASATGETVFDPVRDDRISPRNIRSPV